DGGGADNNWNTAANWDLDVAPVSTDSVVFDATSTKNATINVAVTVAGFSINAGYTGIITASANVINNGSFVIAAGTIDLGSTTFTNGNDWTYTAGTITQGTSTIIFKGYVDHSITITGSHTLANVTFQDYGYSGDPNSNYSSYRDVITMASGTTLTVSGTLTFNDGNVGQTDGVADVEGPGGISAQGDITILGSGYKGAVVITINGSGSQTLTGIASVGGYIPSVTINKSAGTLTLTSIITASNDWTYTAGTLSLGASTVAFRGSRDNAITITGSHTLANVTFQDYGYGGDGANGSYSDAVTIASGTTVTATGTLTLTDAGGSAATINTGAITAQGAITLTGIGRSGTATVTMSGTANQTVTGAGSTTTGDFFATTINKSSGTVTLASILRTSKAITLTQGTFAHDTTATNGLYFTGSGTVMTVGASGTWQNYSATGTSTINFSTGNVVSNSGTVDFEARETCGGTDIIALTTTSGTASWSGAGNYTLYDVNLTNQVASVAIQVNSGTNTSGNTGSWTWSSSCTPTFSLSGYRWFENDDATTVTTALASANTAASAPGTGVPFRLRFLLHVGNVKATLSSQALKLQVAAKSGSCDTAYSGETYADVSTGSGDIRYYDNATPADAAALTTNGSLDPTHSSDTIVAQSYEEANNFMNSVAQIPVGQDGKWDVALVVNTVGASAYCLRVVQSDGSAIATPTVVPEVGIKGSLYSQNHANTSGDLYIYGNYNVPAAGTDYWSYATNFDGASLAGSERRVNVRLASGATVMVPSGATLAIVGGSGTNQSTTVSRISTGGYNITVAGTVNAQYYTMDYLQGANGFYLQSGATVTSISNGTFDNLVGTSATNDAFVTADATLIGTGTPSKTVATLAFANTGSGAECNMRVSGSGQAGYWNMSGSSGAFAGESYDCEPTASPGEIRWVAGGYTTSGYFISTTFDTQQTNGVAYNTLVWKGSKPTNTNVKIQLATSNCSNGATNAPTCNSGAWGATGSNYLGSDCTSASFYTPDANTAVEIKCYTNHNNKRYFKYKVTLETTDTAATPQVDDVVVNYSQ
ncbi:hypothetical protein HY625_01650, partial [Candidatus Uhrbacteria bacterium]|nr:hypothetical protein [Candidatus Uhrbacteria bacterium]